MGLIYVGNAIFVDVADPVGGKTDWGIDTLVRKVKGPRPNAALFEAGLAQGLGFSYGGVNWYLQSWEPDDFNPVWASFTLNYKGLRKGVPPPAITNEVVQGSTSISHQFVPPYEYGSTNGPANSAVLEISFYAPQSIYRYIAASSPAGSQYGSLAFAFGGPRRIRSRISVDNGDFFGGNAPVGLVSALTPQVVTNAISFHSRPIFGTPYFECEDVVQSYFLGD